MVKGGVFSNSFMSRLVWTISPLEKSDYTTFLVQLDLPNRNLQVFTASPPAVTKVVGASGRQPSYNRPC